MQFYRTFGARWLCNTRECCAVEGLECTPPSYAQCSPSPAWDAAAATASVYYDMQHRYSRTIPCTAATVDAGNQWQPTTANGAINSNNTLAKQHDDVSTERSTDSASFLLFSHCTIVSAFLTIFIVTICRRCNTVTGLAAANAADNDMACAHTHTRHGNGRAA